MEPELANHHVLKIMKKQMERDNLHQLLEFQREIAEVNKRLDEFEKQQEEIRKLIKVCSCEKLDGPLKEEDPWQ
jgi:septal ring factor EnvC (AmiA/AmiB activator)